MNEYFVVKFWLIRERVSNKMPKQQKSSPSRAKQILLKYVHKVELELIFAKLKYKHEQNLAFVISFIRLFYESVDSTP